MQCFKTVLFLKFTLPARVGMLTGGNKTANVSLVLNSLYYGAFIYIRVY